MNENRKDYVRLSKAPSCFEVIQEVGGFAEIYVEGELCSWSSYDEDERRFSAEKVYARVIDEENGAEVCAPARVEAIGNYFSVRISGIPVGGPYTVDFTMLDRECPLEYSLGGEKIYHIFVGDVFLIAGQSNAAGMARGIAREVPELGISVMRSLREWDIATMPFGPDSRHNMFLSFAKKIKRSTCRPVGLIPAAVGGAPLSRWLVSERGDLYERALSAIGERKIKAVLWYQGCTDAGDGESTEGYLCRFGKLVEDLRRDLEDPLLPVFTFQLNRHVTREYDAEHDNDYDSVREAQRRAASEIPGVYVLPAIDSTIMSDFIHNSRVSNLMLGERLALQVLNKVYKIGENYDAPEIISATLTDERTVRVTLKNVREYLSDIGASYERYPIILKDKDGVVPLAVSCMTGSGVILKFARDITLPATVTGQHGSDPHAIIIDYGTGMPMLCFKDFPVSAE